MPLWLNKLCIALVTLALLTAPCLSVLGVAPASVAHAHVFAELADDGSEHVEAQGPADHFHVFGSSGGTSPVVPEAECCGLCIGWLTGSAKDQASMTASGRSALVPVDLKNWTQAGLPDLPGIEPFPTRSNSGYVAAESESAFTPLYARTQRLRI